MTNEKRPTANDNNKRCTSRKVSKNSRKNAIKAEELARHARQRITKTIFGFVYSDTEEAQIEKAKADAIEYMERTVPKVRRDRLGVNRYYYEYHPLKNDTASQEEEKKEKA
jgi:hypothetical protein